MLRAGLLGALALAHLFFAPQSAYAGEPARAALFSGADATQNSSFGYAGGVWSPVGNLDAPGFLVRALGGYGRYTYDGSLRLSGGVVPIRFQGDLVLGELMAGYLWRQGEWTIKTFAGVQYADHEISPLDVSNKVSGAAWGAKAQLEIWRNLGQKNWFSADGAYATAFGDYWLQARAGHRVVPWLSLGLELGALGNEEYDAGRGGAFARFHLPGADVTLSAGATGDYFGEDRSAYVSLGLYRKR